MECGRFSLLWELSSLSSPPDSFPAAVATGTLVSRARESAPDGAGSGTLLKSLVAAKSSFSDLTLFWRPAVFSKTNKSFLFFRSNPTLRRGTYDAGRYHTHKLFLDLANALDFCAGRMALC